MNICDDVRAKHKENGREEPQTCANTPQLEEAPSPNGASSLRDSPATRQNPNKKSGWRKIKNIITFTANTRQKTSELKENVDLRYLLVFYVPHENFFKIIVASLKKDIGEMVLRDGRGEVRMCAIDWVSKVVPQTLLTGKAYTGQIRFKFYTFGEQINTATGLECKTHSRPPAKYSLPEELAEQYEEKSCLLVSLTFTMDPKLCILCETDELMNTQRSEGGSGLRFDKTGTPERLIIEEYHRIIALNPRSVMLHEHCLTNEPLELRSWVHGFNWALPELQEDEFAQLKNIKGKNYRRGITDLTVKCILADVINMEAHDGKLRDQKILRRTASLNLELEDMSWGVREDLSRHKQRRSVTDTRSNSLISTTTVQSTLLECCDRLSNITERSTSTSRSVSVVLDEQSSTSNPREGHKTGATHPHKLQSPLDLVIGKERSGNTRNRDKKGKLANYHIDLSDSSDEE